MEEILASIRRIISDEVAAEPQPARSEGLRSEPPVAEVAVDAAPGEKTGDLPAMDAGEPRLTDGSYRRPAAARPVGVPRSPAVSNYVPLGRASSSDPFGASRRPAGVAALAVAETRTAPVERPHVAPPAAEAVAILPEPEAVAAVDDIDLDASLSAALLDLSLVEQAVQAELATITSDAVSGAASSDGAAAIDSGDAAVPAEFDSYPTEASSAAASLHAPSVPETDDMQVQAKPAHVPSRAAAEPAEERRGIESRAAEAARPEPRFPPVGPRPSEAAVAVQPEAPSRLVSTATNSAVSTAFGTLARTVASNSRTVDDLVTEAVKPMLKAWLDENLPALVERLVRAEIERVARQGQ